MKASALSEDRYGKLTREFIYEFDGVPLAGDTLIYNEEQWVIERREWHDIEMVLIVHMVL